MTVSRAWNQIHEWLQANAPRILAGLRPGAGEEARRAVEQAAGVSLPPHWHDLYRMHDGLCCLENMGSLFHGMNFHSLDTVLSGVKHYREVGPGGALTKAEQGITRSALRNPKWIVLGNDESTCDMVVDLDPGEGGRAGQVLCVDHEVAAAVVVAPSVGSLITEFAADLQAGRYYLDEDALEDGDELLQCDREIDVVNWRFSPRWAHVAG